MVPTDTSAFEKGVQALLAAQRSTLGLFPSYDQHLVQEGIEHLEEALGTQSDVFKEGTILYLLAKASLMVDEPLEARRWLNRLMNLDFDLQGEFYAHEAARLLEALSES